MKCNTGTGFVFDMGSLYAHLRTLTDTRQPRGVRYQLETVLTLLVLAKLCGEDRPSGIADWAQHRTPWLVEALALTYPRLPHHSTYRRILADVVAPEELDALVAAYLSQDQQFGRQVVVTIDGKILRGTLDDEGAGVHLLAAYLPSEGIVLLEMAVGPQENEIPVAARLLQCVDLRDKVVIGDALHTQRALSIQIVTAGGDYIWFAKGNQPELEQDIRLWFEPDVPLIPGMGCPPKDFETATTVNKGHGRLERRSLTVSSQLQDFLDWPFLAQVFKLERRFTTLKTGEVQEQVVYGCTSLSREAVSPQRLLAMIRSYWRIENGLHYRRDVTLQEDRTRLTRGHAGQVMAALNNLVLGILDRHTDFPYIPAARRYFAAHPPEALTLIARL